MPTEPADPARTAAPADEAYPFRFAPSYRLAGLPFAVTPRTTGVRLVGGRELRVRYGPWSLRTELANVTGAQRTGGFVWLKTAGPPHLSFTDHGISFSTNGDDAVCLTFERPVRGIDPFGRIRHPGATLTLADPGGFLRRLAELGVPTGESA